MVFSAEKEGDTKDVGRMQPPEKKIGRWAEYMLQVPHRPGKVTSLF